MAQRAAMAAEHAGSAGSSLRSTQTPGVKLMATIERGSAWMSDRYRYDDKLRSSDGWAQLDTTQDASYYGTWINPITFELFNFCEGDLYHTKCDDAADFVLLICL